MRYATIPFFLLMLAGCVTTSGTQSEYLDSEDPYVFAYEGDNVGSDLKRVLLPEGFEAVDEDDEVGMYVFEKTLSDDELIQTTAFTEAMAGVKSGTQQGRLAFTVQPGDTTYVEMAPRIAVSVRQQENLFQSSEDERRCNEAGTSAPDEVREDASRTRALPSYRAGSRSCVAPGQLTAVTSTTAPLCA